MTGMRKTATSSEAPKAMSTVTLSGKADLDAAVKDVMTMEGFGRRG